MIDKGLQGQVLCQRYHKDSVCFFEFVVFLAFLSSCGFHIFVQAGFFTPPSSVVTLSFVPTSLVVLGPRLSLCPRTRRARANKGSAKKAVERFVFWAVLFFSQALSGVTNGSTVACFFNQYLVSLGCYSEEWIKTIRCFIGNL
jgi:hypothetical protein